METSCSAINNLCSGFRRHEGESTMTEVFDSFNYRKLWHPDICRQILGTLQPRKQERKLLISPVLRLQRACCLSSHTCSCQRQHWRFPPIRPPRSHLLLTFTIWSPVLSIIHTVPDNNTNTLTLSLSHHICDSAWACGRVWSRHGLLLRGWHIQKVCCEGWGGLFAFERWVVNNRCVGADLCEIFSSRFPSQQL